MTSFRFLAVKFVRNHPGVSLREVLEFWHWRDIETMIVLDEMEAQDARFEAARLNR